MEFPPDSRDTGKLWTWNAGVSGLSVEYVVRTCASARPPALSIGQVAEAKLRIVTRLPHDIDHGPIVREFLLSTLSASSMPRPPANSRLQCPISHWTPNGCNNFIVLN
ncbi:unnamed protein product [Aspergillus oryzae var. brunneus]|uniref:Unnamed protein product n=1 Tax=Aspergillus oryzae var. brunneus TaxID=332754 RepID=A0ABQ6L7P8_ASPOZ|nr:unnamed protein product [Aspergillus oryzae var. brunneus]